MTTPISFGILLPSLQLSDALLPMDFLHNIQAGELTHLGYPDTLTSKGPTFTFHLISCDPSAKLITSPSGVVTQTTCSIEDCPPLDYLLVGGPRFKWIHEMSPAVRKFLKDRAEREVKSVFTTCDGALVLAEVGLLDGVEATSNHQFTEYTKKTWPNVVWNAGKNWIVSNGKQGREYKEEVDSRFWTGAGVIAGLDMIAHWARLKYGDEIWRVGCGLLDYTPRDSDGKFVEVTLNKP